jgi:hypothetical protein
MLSDVSIPGVCIYVGFQAAVNAMPQASRGLIAQRGIVVAKADAGWLCLETTHFLDLQKNRVLFQWSLGCRSLSDWGHCRGDHAAQGGAGGSAYTARLTRLK